MKSSVITRVLAASAAVGIALILPAAAASAQTLPPVALPVIPPISIGIGTQPILTIGSSVPTTSIATAGTNPTITAAPDPGIRASVPADGHASATAGNPLPGLVAPVVPVLGSAPLPVPAAPLLAGVPGLATLGQPVLADADVQVNACIAAALLTGQPVTNCSSSISGQPSLVDALSTVGLCVRAKVLTGEPVTPCGVTADPAGTAGAPAGGAVPTLGDVAADGNLCLVASILGGTANPCPNPAGVSTGDLPIGDLPIDGTTTPSSTATSLDVCLGVAVLTGTDLTPCTTSTALSDTPPTVTDPTSGTSSTDNPTSGVSGTNGFPTGNGSAATPTQNAALDLSTVANGDGNLGTPLGTLPFTGSDVGVMVLFALSLIASGIALRRLRNGHDRGHRLEHLGHLGQHRSGSDTRFPRRPHNVG